MRGTSWVVRCVGLALLACVISVVGARAARADTKLLYGITSDGRLEWLEHAGWKSGDPLTADPVPLGTGFGEFTKVFGGCNGVFYAIRPNGELVWFKHTASGLEGPTTVGTGWADFRDVFADCMGTIYAMQPDGDLLWYRHVGAATGTQEWKGPTVVGSGFTVFERVFSGCYGNVYGIKPSGEILWLDHQDPAEGAPDWSGPNAVGTGWAGFASVFSGCDGVVYAIKASGELIWSDHAGAADGDDEWLGPIQIREGVHYTTAFAMPWPGARGGDKPQGCPVIDASGNPRDTGMFLFSAFPAEQTSIFTATHVDAQGAPHPGQAGVDRIVDVIMRSLKPACAPVGLVNIVGGADFDSRGRGFEDTVSIERSWKAGHEIKAALEAVRVPAVARGEIVDKRVYFSSAGVGTRVPVTKSPASEDERKTNRWLWVYLVQEHQPGGATPPTSTEAAPFMQ